MKGDLKSLNFHDGAVKNEIRLYEEKTKLSVPSEKSADKLFTDNYLKIMPIPHLYKLPPYFMNLKPGILLVSCGI